MSKSYIARLDNLSPDDYRAIRRLADEKGLGKKGFSAALRMIIHEWLFFRQLTLKAASTALASSPSDPNPDLLQE